jgi:hypothetical protein
MTYVSAGCLFLVCFMCVSAIFSKKFVENWIQWFGFVGLSFWSLARGIEMLDRDQIGIQQLISHVSMALIAVGTALQYRSAK